MIDTQTTEYEEAQVVITDGYSVIHNEEFAENVGLIEKLSQSNTDEIITFNGYDLYYATLQESDIQLFMFFPHSIRTFFNLGQLILIVITAVSFYAVIYLYQFMQNDFVKPLNDLTGLMNNIRQGEINEILRGPL